MDMIPVGLTRFIVAEKPPKGSNEERTLYHALKHGHRNRHLSPFDFMRAVIGGRSFAPHMNPEIRENKNFLVAQHIAIDLDKGDMPLDVLCGDTLVANHASFAYETHSSTPEFPRTRVVFILSAPITSAELYWKMQRALTSLFPTADRQRAYPSASFLGGKPGKGNSLWIGETIPNSLLIRMVEVEEVEAEERRERVRASQSVIPTSELQRILVALSYIDEWAIDYEAWRNIIFAVKSAFPGDDGLELLLSWSQSKREVEYLWGKVEQVGVGLGTLYKTAKMFGFSTKERK